MCLREFTANVVNSETCKIIDHKVYCFCGDGDLEEGISYEACALAGKLRLKDLICNAMIVIISPLRAIPN